MIIEYTGSQKMKNLGELFCGDVFTHREHKTPFMRIDSARVSISGDNAVINLTLNRVTSLPISTAVIHYPEAKLVMGRSME